MKNISNFLYSVYNMLMRMNPIMLFAISALFCVIGLIAVVDAVYINLWNVSETGSIVIAGVAIIFGYMGMVFMEANVKTRVQQTSTEPEPEPIPELIPLSNAEQKLILFCKNHYRHIYPSKGEWTESIKPLFNEIYGWDADEHYDDFLQCLFNKLLDIYMKIRDDRSGSNMQLKEIFEASFSPRFHRNQERPIERAIAALCGLIHSTRYRDENNNKRYELNEKVHIPQPVNVEADAKIS